MALGGRFQRQASQPQAAHPSGSFGGREQVHDGPQVLVRRNVVRFEFGDGLARHGFSMNVDAREVAVRYVLVVAGFLWRLEADLRTAVEVDESRNTDPVASASTSPLPPDLRRSSR